MRGGRAQREIESNRVLAPAKERSLEVTRESRPDERLVDRAVAHLRGLVVGGQVQTMVEVGEYLVREFYGSIENARSHHPRKAASLALLASRAGEFGMAPSTLAGTVPMALAARELGHGLAQNLGVSR